MGLIWNLPILNLNLIDQRDSGIITISDSSTYGLIPTVYNLQITPPDGYQTVNPTFTPGQVNIYKCVDLGITCSDTGCTPLPDGIYTITYSVTGAGATDPRTVTTLEVKFIKIDQIKCKYQHAFLSVENSITCCNNPAWTQAMDNLRHIKLYIDGSVAQCNQSNYRLSYEFYHRATTMLNKLKCSFPNVRWTTGCGCK